MTDQLKREDAPEDPKMGEGTELFDRPFFQVVVGLGILAVCSVPVALWFAAFGFVDVRAGNVIQAEPLMTLFAAIVAMFGVLMAGIFVFMAIRIDRGARREAQSIAERAGKKAKRVARKKATDITKSVQKEASESIARVDEELRQAKCRLDEMSKSVERRIQDRFVELRNRAKAEATAARDNGDGTKADTYKHLAALFEDGQSPNESG